MASAKSSITYTTTFIETFSITAINGAPSAITLSTSTEYTAVPGTFSISLTLLDKNTPHTTIVAVTIPSTTSSSSSPTKVEITPKQSSTTPGTSSVSSISSISQLSSSTQSTTTTLPTSSTSSTTSASHTTKHSKPSGVSNGEVAGIAIACLAIGALFAAILVFFCLKKRRGPGKQGAIHDFHVTGNKNTSPEPKHASVAMTQIPPALTIGRLESRLPQPLPEDTIAKDINMLRIAIKNHAHNYYLKTGNAAIGGTAFAGAMANLLGAKSPINSKRLALLLSQPKTRIDAIRFLLAWTILGRLKHSASPDTTILPPELAECMFSMTAMQEDTECKSPFSIHLRKQHEITIAILTNLSLHSPSFKMASNICAPSPAIPRSHSTRGHTHKQYPTSRFRTRKGPPTTCIGSHVRH